MTSDDVPQNPFERAAWVRRRLALRGTSLAAVARRRGVSHQAVYQALRLPSAAIEVAIAEAVGLPVERLFPERFHPDGGRRHREMILVRVARPRKAEKRRHFGQSRAAT